MSRSVFPAHAGMSLLVHIGLERNSRFPRTRGDEPSAAKSCTRAFKFSPHTRG